MNRWCLVTVLMAILSVWIVGETEVRAGDDLAPLLTRGPLRASSDNPRYFADSENRIVYLTGSHSWENFQDITATFNYQAYLDRLTARHHNFIRMWVGESTRSDAGWLLQPPAQDNSVTPLPYLRTGPGVASDGGPRLDLTRFNPVYFERLRARVQQAGRRGYYVSVMLFQGFSVVEPHAWKAHPFNASNNVNGINGDEDGDGVGTEVHRSPASQVLSAQEAYVGRVLDTLHDMDNVLYEVVNEAIPESVSWQYHLIRFIQQYEREHQYVAHPVGMTFFQLGEFGGGDNTALFDSPADWISPGGYTKYARNPPTADGRKVILLDTDHIHGIGGDQDFVWESFFRGYNPIYMDPLDAPHELTIGEPVRNEAQHERARVAMGEARRWATILDLRRVIPRGDLASTGYCLAEPGREYLVYIPAGGASAPSTDDNGARPVTLNLNGAGGSFSVEWIDVEARSAILVQPIQGGGERLFTVPFPGATLLHLKTRS